MFYLRQNIKQMNFFFKAFKFKFKLEVFQKINHWIIRFWFIIFNIIFFCLWNVLLLSSNNREYQTLALFDPVDFYDFYRQHDKIMPSERHGIGFQPLDFGDFEEELYNYYTFEDLRNFICYIISWEFFDERSPLHINSVIVDYYNFNYKQLTLKTSWFRDTNQWVRQVKIFKGLCIDFLRRWLFLTKLTKPFPILFTKFFDWFYVFNKYFVVIEQNRFWYYFNELTFQDGNVLNYHDKQTIQFFLGLPMRLITTEQSHELVFFKKSLFLPIFINMWKILRLAPDINNSVIRQVKFDIQILAKKLKCYKKWENRLAGFVLANGYHQYLFFLCQIILHFSPSNGFFKLIAVEIERYYFLRSYAI